MLDINWSPSRRELQIFAALLALFLSGLGLLLFLPGSEWRWLLWSLAVLVALAGWLVPERLRIVYQGWMLAAYPIGWTVSHLLLAAIYYGLMTPIGLLLRWTGRDPLTRRFDRSAESYWTAKPHDDDPNRYFRPY